jgi:hypothetical protein
LNLADMLSYADIGQLSRIASSYDCECDGHSKKELIQSILSTISRKDVFERQIASMSLEDLRFVNSLLYESRELFSLEELIAHVSHTRFEKDETKDRNPRDVIASFKQRGWLFNGYSQQTRYLFQIPQDLKRRFGDALANHFQKKLVFAGEPSAYRDEASFIVDDIVHTCRYIGQNPMILTADGYLYKRALQQLLDTGAVKEEPPSRGAWRFGYGRKYKEYPSRFSLIYDYAFFNDLIAEEADSLRLTDKGKEVVSGELRVDIQDVYRFWLKLYRGPIHNLVSIVHWVERLAKDWVSYSSLAAILEPLIRPYYYDSPSSILEQRIIQMMMHLGLLRIGEDENFGKVLKVTSIGSQLIRSHILKEEERIRLDSPKHGLR